MTRKKILLDCDTGVDDSMAILYLLASDVELVAITSCFGNISAAQAAQNSLRLLELTGVDGVPVPKVAR